MNPEMHTPLSPELVLHRPGPHGLDLDADGNRGERQDLAAMAELNRHLDQQNQELKAALKRLTQLAYIDSLTGLANRRYFEFALNSEIRRAPRTGKPVTLALCDIDHFKRFNDTFGHQCGDKVLRAVGKLLLKHCRRGGDVAARYGGEEFALILPGLDSGAMMAIIVTLRQDVANLQLRGRKPQERMRVTISIGVTTFRPGAPCAPSELIKSADRGLYRAKEAGRNRTKYVALRSTSH
jgi:diguanylate cyclase